MLSFFSFIYLTHLFIYLSIFFICWTFIYRAFYLFNCIYFVGSDHREERQQGIVGWMQTAQVSKHEAKPWETPLQPAPVRGVPPLLPKRSLWGSQPPMPVSSITACLGAPSVANCLKGQESRGKGRGGWSCLKCTKSPRGASVWCWNDTEKMAALRDENITSLAVDFAACFAQRHCWIGTKFL